MNDSEKYQVSRWVKILFWTLIPLGTLVVTVTLTARRGGSPS